jgi:hypothetical protein
MLGLESLEGAFGLGFSQANALWGPSEPDEEGWCRYVPGSLPPEKALCLFKRGDDGEPWVGYAGFYPEFNIAYLKWKLTGIAKESL